MDALRAFHWPAVAMATFAAALGVLPVAASCAEPSTALLPGEPTLAIGALDLKALDYVSEEFIVEGNANSYEDLGSDAQGHWNARPATTAPYATRIVVIRPAKAAHFNGNVVVEWLNVSGGVDFGPVWNVTRRELVRSGTAYVAVSAQRVGIEGGLSFTAAGLPLKKVNPARYGRLHHPGDAFSFDIFSQIGQLAKARTSPVMGELPVRHVIAVGESQSAGFLTTYVNAVDPVVKVFDGFLIHSRFGSAPELNPVPIGAGDRSQASGRGNLPPQRFVRMRPDLRVPVMTFLTETDVLGFAGRGGYAAVRQPDTDRLRVWETAGTAHADAYFMTVGGMDSGKATPDELATAYAPSNNLRGVPLAKPFNNAPQHHYIMQAAISALQRWVDGGRAPAHGSALVLTGNGSAESPFTPVLDDQGNIMGGVRSPWMNVPTGRLAGVGNQGSPVAALYGLSEPFAPETLARLYPGGRKDYVARFSRDLDRTIAAGFILPADRDEILALAGAAWSGTR